MTLLILKERKDFYETRNPESSDKLLVVEVSHTSVSYDKNVKPPLYAESGIAEYWQVDIKKEMLIVRTDRRDGEYHDVRILRRGDKVNPQKLPAFTFEVAEILG